MQPMKALIAVDDKAQFRNDVQLSLFEDPEENLALLDSFIFTVAGVGHRRVTSSEQVSSTELLNQLVEAFNDSRSENRMVAIANYGHGKSHLALALTNYFSKPFDSDEAQTVLNKLEHALNDDSKWSRFYDFKELRGEFLVVRLRGDVPRSLREQFLPALEKALQEHRGTADVKPPMWHTYAANLLSQLSPAEIERANEALAPHRLDVASLLVQVQERKDVREHCLQALNAAKGMVPDLGAQLSLAESLEWVADNLCGEGKPLSGVLVLFDEFSLYVSRYAQRSAVVELQDLLNGVSNRRTKIAFLAFAQHDPLTVADNAATSAHGRDTLKHELTRIPKKMSLYTLMEHVLNAYLRQRDYYWDEFVEDRDIYGAITRASHVAYEAFKHRYIDELQWLPGEFEERVTKGSFPLHPLTTALLCNLQFQEASGMSDPRTVLGFVMEHLNRKLQETTAIDGRVNWVHPVALVDYFGERIAPDIHASYLNARRNLPIQAEPVWEEMLKALYLQAAAQLKLTREQQLEFVAEATGFYYDKIKAGLRSLSDANVIRYDALLKVYSFWPVNADPGRLERLLRGKLEKNEFDRLSLNQLNREFAKIYGGETFSVTVDWGHPEDWAAGQYIVTREFFDSTVLQTLTQTYEVSNRGMQEGTRGAVIWLLAQDEEEIKWCHEKVNDILDDVLRDDTVPPLIVMLSQEAFPDLCRAFQRIQVLQSLSTAERADVGTVIFDHETKQAASTFKAELNRFIGEPNNYIDLARDLSVFATSVRFRSTLHTVQSTSVRSVIRHLYTHAYRTNPREFFTQYKAASTTRLKNAVKLIAGALITGHSTDLKSLVGIDPVADETCKQFLIKRWGMLTPSYELKEPGTQRLLQAWKLLEEEFKPGTKEKPLAPALVKLLNPPNGYDYNTATLLFSAWLGFHLHDFGLIQYGREIKPDALKEHLQKSPKDFLIALKSENIALSRRNPDEERKEVQGILTSLRRVGVGLSLQEAEHALQKLRLFAENEGHSERERTDAQGAANNLEQLLAQVNTYRMKVEQIRRAISMEMNYAELLNQFAAISDLPELKLITTDLPGRTVLRESLLNRIGNLVQERCQTMEQPEDLTEIGLYRRQLENMEGNLRQAGLPQFAERVRQARQRLNEQMKILETKDAEKDVIRRIQAIDSRRRLAELIEHKQWLDSLVGYSADLLAQRDRKLLEVEESIRFLVQQVQDFPRAVEKVASRQEASSLRDRWNRMLNRYDESSYAEELEVLLSKLAKLSKFFEAVEKLPAQIRTPEEISLFDGQIAQIRESYHQILSEPQRASLSRAEETFRRAINSRRTQAMDWLNLCAKEVAKLESLSGKQIADLQKRLASPPAFLPEDQSARLGDLRSEVQTHLDNDAILQIETIFRKIGDRKRRQECLNRLSAIIQEESEPMMAD